MEKYIDNIERAVVTGGVCSGKSTGLSKIADAALDRGRAPFLVPETPTELHDMGIFELNMPNEKLQEIIIKYQTRAEQNTIKTIKQLTPILQGRKPLMLCDRGLADGGAYIDPKSFDDALKSCGYPQGVTDIFGWYHVVIHLETAPKEYYTTDNNPARGEKTREEAMVKNDKTKGAWLGFPHYRIIGNNYDSFNEKIWAASNAILQGLGDPAAYEREDKYEVEDVLFPLFEKYGVRLIESNVEQDYLLSDTSDIVRRVRRRGWAPGCRIYTYTEKDRTTDIEHEKIIDREKYETLLQEKDLRRTTLKKKRYNFVREGHYFELDHFLSGKKKGKRLLEIEKATKEQVVELPPFLNIIAKVDRKNEEMARIV